MWNLKRILTIKPFINKYSWDKLKYPSKIDDCKTLEKNNSTFALNVLYTKKLEICPAYISKKDSNREKKITLLVIPIEKHWYYLSLKNCLHN